MTNTELQKNRLLALAIDAGALIVLAVVLSVGTFIGALLPWLVGVVVQVVTSVILLGAVLARDFVVNGNSLGKHLMKVRVVQADGLPIEIMHSVKRNMIYAIPGVIQLLAALIGIIPILGGIIGALIGLVNILVALAILGVAAWEVYTITQHPDGIRWGDTLAGTRVVAMDVVPTAPPAEAMPIPPPPPPPPPPTE